MILFTKLKINLTTKLIAAFVIFSFSLSCTSGSTILVGTKKAATDPTKVKIYLDLPAKYDNIALLEVSKQLVFSQQTTQDKVILELKVRAAEIGANGLFLVKTKTNPGTFSSYDDDGDYKSGNSGLVITQARAIYVLPD